MNQSRKEKSSNNNDNKITMDQWLSDKERQQRCQRVLAQINMVSPEKRTRIYNNYGNSYCPSCVTPTVSPPTIITSTGISTPY